MAQKFKILRFCPECSCILYPQEDNKCLTYYCANSNCGEREKIADPTNVLDNTVTKKDIKETKQKIHIDPDIVLDPSMPRTRDVTCPKCEFNEAVFTLISSADDKYLKYKYICARVENDSPSCGYTWEKELAS